MIAFRCVLLGGLTSSEIAEPYPVSWLTGSTKQPTAEARHLRAA